MKDGQARSLGDNQHVRPLGLSGLAGWIMLVVVLGIDYFVIPHGPGFAPEMGRFATFLVFGLLFSASYLCVFIACGIPFHWLLRSRIGRAHWRVWSICGCAIFGIGIMVFNRIFSGPTDFGSRIFEFLMGCLAGIAVFSVLRIPHSRRS